MKALSCDYCSEHDLILIDILHVHCSHICENLLLAKWLPVDQKQGLTMASFTAVDCLLALNPQAYLMLSYSCFSKQLKTGLCMGKAWE